MSNSTSSGRKVNVAVVGLGFMGVTHIKAYQQIESARIVSVCDAVRLPVNGILPGIAGNLSGNDAVNLGSAIKASRVLDEVLADPEVDLVDLCVPTPMHHPQAIAALKAGKHVICENRWPATRSWRGKLSKPPKLPRAISCPPCASVFGRNGPGSNKP